MERYQCAVYGTNDMVHLLFASSKLRKIIEQEVWIYQTDTRATICKDRIKYSSNQRDIR